MCELLPSHVDLCRMVVVAECDIVCLGCFWTEFVTGCLWVGYADPREAVGWSQGPDHD